MKIYIDVTRLLSVPYLTGIQRVVREVVLRMLQQTEAEIILLSYNEYYHLFEQVDNLRFCAFYGKGEGERQKVITDTIVDWTELKAGDIFFDIDSVWNLPLRRSVLLPKLKANGVKLVAYIYDIIPITHPQFCHGETVYNFMNYIGAYLQYADLLIASAQSTLDAVAELLEQLELPPIPGVVSWLGSDFNGLKDESADIHPDAAAAVEAGKYVLMVGTIEPRKNHALVLDAFDHGLFQKGMNLIFAGGIGWNVREFQKRMEQHPKRDQQFFYLQGMDDATIDYLYQHAYCVVFPTFNEGFGLPMIEAFQRGIPVLASDIPILREVGGEFCSYFDPASRKEFSDMLMNWLTHPEEYEACKNRLKAYIPVTWDTVAETIWKALIDMRDQFPYLVPDEIRQMVYLTARVEDLLESLPFVEHFMPFIEELVLCCPDVMIPEMKQRYTGRLSIRYLSDSDLLQGQALPADHAVRNFFLRCLAMRQDILDDVFLMSDDDYRPLCPISQDVFLKNGRYQGYYCYHLENWKGDQSQPSSFDISMYRTRDFLKEHGYSFWMFDSHMPQIIDRRVFCEMLSEYPEIQSQGLSDWSMYFNYLNTRYSEQVENHPFATLAWPGMASAWDRMILPQRLLFENYYSELYDDGGLFQGCSRCYYEGIEQENADKIVRYMNEQAEHEQAKAMFQAYRANYEMLYGEYPCFSIRLEEGNCEITLPEYMMISEIGFTRIPFVMDDRTELKEDIEVNYRMLDVLGNVLQEGETMIIRSKEPVIEIPVKSIHGSLKAVFELGVRCRDMEYKSCTKLCIMQKGK